MPGPPRKPTKLKLIEGNPGKQKLHREPQPDLGSTPCPSHLPPLGKKMWKHLVQHLDALNLLAKLDSTILEGICVAYARAVEADTILSRDGLTFQSGDNYRQQRPEVAISHNCWRRVKEFATEYGMTPASRGKLSSGSPNEEDDLEAMLAGPRTDR